MCELAFFFYSNASFCSTHSQSVLESRELVNLTPTFNYIFLLTSVSYVLKNG